MLKSSARIGVSSAGGETLDQGPIARPINRCDVARSQPPIDIRGTAVPSSRKDMPCAGIRRSQDSNHPSPIALLRGARMRRARAPNQPRVDDKGESIGGDSFGNYLEPARSVALIDCLKIRNGPI